MGRIKILIFVLLFYGCCRPLQLIEKWRTEALFLNQEEGYAARISSWDRTGGNIDYIRLAPGETVTLAEISGAGVIRHIWMTFNAREPMGRLLVLRMYWDGAQQPAVEVPIGDFFGVGNGMLAEVNSFPITVSSRGRALNCWWQMPFAKGAKITITNEGYEPINTFYYYIDYLALKTSPGTKERFYAQYRQAYPASSLENYLILETSGRGRYVGTVLSVESTKPDWWGEGDELICVDNREPLRGTGTEDYFCYAWGMKPHSTLWHGSPVCEGYDAPGLRTTMYRFHILDPIPFQKHISVSIEHGTNNNRADNLSSVAFWYQVPPATTFPQLPAAAERLVGKSRNKFIRQQLWHLTINKAPDLSTKLEELLSQVKDEENVHLFKGLQAYADGVRELNEEAVVNMEFYLGLLKGLIEAQPAGERYTSPTIEAATDDDSPVPGSTVEAYRMVERLKFDLQRQIELKRGFKPGDEIVIEVRDSQGRLTPSPLYEDTMDFTNSYAKADDTRLTGNGSRFTYGGAESSWARFTPYFPRSGRYEVFTIFSYGANADDTRYEIRHTEGITEIALPQRGRPGTSKRNHNQWHSLGIYRFQAGQNPELGSITLNAAPGTKPANNKFEYRAYADAIRLVFRGE